MFKFSQTKFKLFYFILISSIGIKLAFGMEPNNTNTLSFTLNGLQNDFIGLRKNPHKYVKFLLNTDKTNYPDASGLYELLPYYKKVNALEETTNYSIKWSDFDNEWQLIKENPMGMFPRFDVEETTIATILTRDQFSKHKKTDIKAYKTLESIKTNTQNVAQQNKELKKSLTMLQNELAEEKMKNKHLQENTKLKIEELHTENDFLHNQFFDLQQKHNDLLAQQKAKQQILDSNTKRMREYENKFAELNPKKVETERKNLEEKIEKQINKIDRLEQEKSNLQANCVYLKSLYDENTHHIPKFQKEIVNYKKELKEKNEILENNKNEIFDTNRKLDGIVKEIDKYQQKIEILQKENEEMKKELILRMDIEKEINEAKEKTAKYCKKRYMYNAMQAKHSRLKFYKNKQKEKDLQSDYETPKKQSKIYSDYQTPQKKSKNSEY